MKAILMSIRPQYAAKILNNEKTIEIRKTMPKCDLPIDVYIYCTKGKQILKGLIAKSWYGLGGYFDYENLNGKVVAKFTLNKIRTSDMTNCLQGSCLSYDEVNEYTKGKKFYGWVIDNLVIFDKPKELSEFKYYKKFSEIDYMLPIPRKETCERLVALTRAPQSYMFIEV